jgi:adenine-specific DNA-methyltransferase
MGIVGESTIQKSLFEGWDDDFLGREDPKYLSRQLITYLGNKRGLAQYLERAILEVRRRVGGRKLVTADLFAGSGFVARLFKQHSTLVIANDLESYSAVVNKCYLANRNNELDSEVADVVRRLNRRADAGETHLGFIREMYSPCDDRNIRPGERVFYTNDNARRLDFFAQEIALLDEPVKTRVLAPLLSRASMHANTSGVFKGFYKDKYTDIGKFGGAGGDALKRILEPIRLETPVQSRFETNSLVMQHDANAAVDNLPDCDLVYIDPPYNQHPYGSNYFMLNLFVNYRRPSDISTVSGIPKDWNRSGYNVKKQALPLMADLFTRLKARFLLVSFNAEGFISTSELRSVLDVQGRVEEIVVPYNTFRGSRNLRNRSIYVNEHLFLLDREG